MVASLGLAYPFHYLLLHLLQFSFCFCYLGLKLVTFHDFCQQQKYQQNFEGSFNRHRVSDYLTHLESNETGKKLVTSLRDTMQRNILDVVGKGSSSAQRCFRLGMEEAHSQLSRKELNKQCYSSTSVSTILFSFHMTIVLW